MTEKKLMPFNINFSSEEHGRVFTFGSLKFSHVIMASLREKFPQADLKELLGLMHPELAPFADTDQIIVPPQGDRGALSFGNLFDSPRRLEEYKARLGTDFFEEFLERVAIFRQNYEANHPSTTNL